MAAKLALFLLFIAFCSLLPLPSLAVTANSSGTNMLCDQTPHPEACKYFMNHVPSEKSEFRKMAVQIAMERAVLGQTHAKGLGPKCRNEREKAAWNDCLSLYENAIIELNKTLETNRNSSFFDQQTWLSTALTNLETCKAGFIELGVSDFILPLMSNNVSKLISNSLSIKSNAASEKQRATYEEGFPSWVSRNDRRKLLQAAASTTASANLVVAKDGSGNYDTVQAALSAAANRKGTGRFIIYVKSGVYNENLVIGKNLKNIMLVGDGLSSTIISGSRSVGGGYTTFNSATVGVIGDGFIARGITFRNTAGAQNHQAVALRSGSDLSVFYQCGFEGYQDTLYAHSQRQFYQECNIYGTVDFIFGNAAAVFQDCNIYVRKPMASQENTVTAQGRSDPNQNTGTVIQSSKIMANSDLQPVVSSFNTFLGRPWGQYSRTIIMETYIDSLVNSAGWLEWDGNFALSTLFYGEYKNSGPGSSTSGRVKWGGYKVITSATEAAEFSVDNFIAGQSWLPATGVPFTGSV
ncbi:hypothetical protein Nepgr_010633 [Nepenthes gracilis]|uniref:Pectinesterase n=1 Tax=Nepenthes gracilis TaxID=150966 RepID=A0AAD3SCQ9_NEPGR|nr:hypothetical protein Nepgr_010633 [Nepenthes gracilis]